MSPSFAGGGGIFQGPRKWTFSAPDPDVKFRLDLARNELRLSSSPTQESVLKCYQHALAELQQVTPTTTKRQQDSPKLKGANTNAAGTGGSTSQPGSPKKGKGPCKFFASDAGCKRGSNCPYTHEFSSKADRKQRGWTCGSTSHRQSECPTTAAKGNGKSSSTHQRPYLPQWQGPKLSRRPQLLQVPRVTTAPQPQLRVLPMMVEQHSVTRCVSCCRKRTLC